jgi:hypothetical protein
MSFEKERPLGFNEAMARIAMLEQQAMGMGANDAEASLFANVRRQLEAGDITATEAVAAAQAILDGKQDYH